MKELTAYVMVGAPGSGKSTYAAKLAKIEDARVVSGDDVREKLYGSVEIQGDWVEIHDRIEELISEACGMPVILDGTYYLSSYRREAINLLKSYGYTKVEAIVCNPSLATCLARNWSRPRNVPDYAVKEMYEKLQHSLKDIINEPFDRLDFIL